MHTAKMSPVPVAIDEKAPVVIKSEHNTTARKLLLSLVLGLSLLTVAVRYTAMMMPPNAQPMQEITKASRVEAAQQLLTATYQEGGVTKKREYTNEHIVEATGLSWEEVEGMRPRN